MPRSFSAAATTVMPDTRRPESQGPRHTRHSHRVIEMTSLGNADVLYQVGTIIWHPDSQRFLLFITRKGPYRLPTQPAEGNLAPSLRDPLGFVARETGHKIAPVRLRKFERLYKNPTSETNEDLGLVPAAAKTESTHHFKVTVDMLCDPERLQRGQPRQVVTWWFAGVISDSNPPIVAPAKPTASTVRVAHLLPRAHTFDEFMKRGYSGTQDVAVLEAFVKLWNLTYPENKII